MKVTLVSKSKYAEMRGCAPSAVTKAIAEGRITTVQSDGREMIDPEVADIQWQRNTRARIDSTSATEASRAVIVAHEVGARETYEDARRRRELAEAQIAELKLLEQMGSLVRLTEVRSAMAAKVAAMREALMQIPSRLVPVLAAESDPAKIHASLESELVQALAFVSGDAD